MSGGTGTVFLYGAGGHAKVVLDVLRARGIFPSCVCDDAPEAASEFCGLPVLRGTAAASFLHENLRVFRGENLVASASGAPAERSAA